MAPLQPDAERLEEIRAGVKAECCPEAGICSNSDQSAVALWADAGVAPPPPNQQACFSAGPSPLAGALRTPSRQAGGAGAASALRPSGVALPAARSPPNAQRRLGEAG